MRNGYKIASHVDEIVVMSEDGHFSGEAKADLWEKHKILYIGGIIAVLVEENLEPCFRRPSPILHLMWEDDGVLLWRRKQDVCFHATWLGNVIETLTTLKEKLEG